MIGAMVMVVLNSYKIICSNLDIMNQQINKLEAMHDSDIKKNSKTFMICLTDGVEIKLLMTDNIKSEMAYLQRYRNSTIVLLYSLYDLEENVYNVYKMLLKLLFNYRSFDSFMISEYQIYKKYFPMEFEYMIDNYDQTYIDNVRTSVRGMYYEPESVLNFNDDVFEKCMSLTEEEIKRYSYYIGMPEEQMTFIMIDENNNFVVNNKAFSTIFPFRFSFLLRKKEYLYDENTGYKIVRIS